MIALSFQQLFSSSFPWPDNEQFHIKTTTKKTYFLKDSRMFQREQDWGGSWSSTNNSILVLKEFAECSHATRRASHIAISSQATVWGDDRNWETGSKVWVKSEDGSLYTTSHQEPLHLSVSPRGSGSPREVAGTDSRPCLRQATLLLWGSSSTSSCLPGPA